MIGWFSTLFSFTARLLPYYIFISAPVIALTEQSPLTSLTLKGYAHTAVSLDNVSVQSHEADLQTWEMNSNTSFVGLQGQYAIDSQTHAIFKIEYDVFIDDGKSRSNQGNEAVEQRDIFIGLKSPWGTVTAGRRNTPLRGIQGTLDRFNFQTYTDIRSYIEGEDRVDNIITFISPIVKHLQTRFSLVALEKNQDDTIAADTGRSFTLNYQRNTFSIAAGHNDNIDEQATYRFVINHHWKKWGASALHQTARSIMGTEKETSRILSFDYAFNKPWKIRGQWGKTVHKPVSRFKNADKFTGVGLTYQWAKHIKAFLNYTHLDLHAANNQFTREKIFSVGYEWWIRH